MPLPLAPIRSIHPLLGVAAGISSIALLVIAAGGPCKLWDVIRARVDVTILQLKNITNCGGSILRWPETQYHIWTLLNIEARHLAEDYENRRLGKTAYEAGLAHVDTANAKDAEKARNMMMDAMNQPMLKTLVLIGGGHTHAFVLKMFGMKPMAGVRVVLITRDVLTPYSGMLPGHVAGMYTKEECHIDLVKLGEFANAGLIHASATGIDTKNKLVMLDNGQPPVPYDVLSIDIGCTPATNQIKEITNPESKITRVKPIDGFSARWDAVLERVVSNPEISSGKQKKPFQIKVVGAGAGGVELACSMIERIRSELKKRGKPTEHIEMGVVSRGDDLMGSHAPPVRALFRSILESKNIKIHLGCEVVDVLRLDADEKNEKNKKSAGEGGEGRGGILVCKSGEKIAYDECIWCTSAGAAAWLKETGLSVDARGFLLTNEFLQTSDENIFAAGDCASMRDYPRPKAGVFAVRAGPPLNKNIRALLSNLPLEPYEPQSSFLGIIGTGNPEVAVASKGTMCISAPWLWGLKDYIDRKWMGDYTWVLGPKKQKMAEMMEVTPPQVATGPAALAILKEATMRCGGCGSKVGGSILSKVMARLRKHNVGDIKQNPHVLVGIDSPDDCAILKPPAEGKVLVQTVDFFRSFISDPYVFGMVAANHALSDCHAMGAQTVSALAIAVIPYSSPPVMEELLYRIMAGANKVLEESGCTLVGGHTCEGPELALGFAVNGHVDQDKAMTKGGMGVGESIILTKPVGTGALFAANMRCEARGVDVKNALVTMCKTNKVAGELLSDYGATSCTDVTGFGVLGHLHEMVKASDVGATINLSSVPLLGGAQACIRKGIFSSLHEDNARLRKIIDVDHKLREDTSFPLLFDPQTAGGLLASVASDRAEKCVQALRKSGYPHATIIGSVTARKNGIRVLK